MLLNRLGVTEKTGVAESTDVTENVIKISVDTHLHPLTELLGHRVAARVLRAQVSAPLHQVLAFLPLS